MSYLYIAELCLLALDTALAVLIWLVQLIIYPSFLFTDPKKFSQWHRDYTNRIGYIVVPLMLAQLGLSTWLCITLPEHEPLQYAHLFFVISSWAFTFTLSVPIHKQLGLQGYQPDLLRKLVRTNLPRAIAWSLALTISLYHVLWAK